MLPGVTITMGGRDWLVPPLTLGQLRRLMPKVRQLTEIGASMGETQIGVLVEIVAAALQRNYPEATAEMVENRKSARSRQCRCRAQCGSDRLRAKAAG